jgi:hypothetical protein
VFLVSRSLGPMSSRGGTRHPPGGYDLDPSQLTAFPEYSLDYSLDLLHFLVAQSVQSL